MTIERVVTVGDSVAWGQGLAYAGKFGSLVTEALTGEIPDRTDILGRSGAPIGRGRCGNPLDVDDRTARHEVPFAFPTLFEQLDQIQAPGTIDLLLVTGGINDVGVDTILNPTTSHDDLEAAIRAACFEDMRAFIAAARSRCPSAFIAVTGYYPILSDETSSALIASSIGLLVGAMTGNPVPGILAGGVSVALIERIIANAAFTHTQMLYWLRRAVTESDDGRVAFVHPGFEAENAVFADEPFLFNPGDLGNSTIAAARRRGCDEAATAGEIDDGYVSRCYIASTGHPNEAGARRYAERIVEVIEVVQRQSLREPVKRLTPGRNSVRTALERYSLKPSAGVRVALSHLAVDCLRITIETGDDGTDASVSLDIGNREWPLNRTLADDFEAGSTEVFVIDPRLGQDGDRPGPLMLWEISDARIRKNQPGPFEATWELERVELEVNGHSVSTVSPSSALAGDASLSLSYPRGAA